MYIILFYNDIEKIKYNDKNKIIINIIYEIILNWKSMKYFYD